MAMVERWLTLVGIGDDGLPSLSAAARSLYDGARVVFAPERVLALLDTRGKETIAWDGGLSAMLDQLMARRGQPVLVFATGDPMHYGIGATLLRRLSADEMTVIPSPSAFSLAAARLGWALQDVTCLSLHGRPVHRLAAVLAPGMRILALTSGARTIAAVAEILIARGFGDTLLTILEHMGGKDERIVVRKASDVTEQDNFAEFNTLAIDCGDATDAVWHGWAAGIADDAFDHDGQLTKREIRAVTLSRLKPAPGALLWDIGAGCGSIGIEWMRAARGARAIGIEPDANRRAMAAVNALSLGTPDLDIRPGSAPSAMAGLGTPDAVFIGGGLSGDGVFETAFQALRPGGRLVANAVTVESERRLFDLQGRHGGDLVRLSIARAEPVGRFLGWKPLMPVTLYAVEKR